MTNELSEQMRLARKALESGEVAKARRMLRRIVHQEADNYRAWLWLGGVTDAPAAAMQYIKRAQDLAPTDQAVVQAIGWAERRMAEGNADTQRLIAGERTTFMPADMTAVAEPNGVMLDNAGSVAATSVEQVQVGTPVEEDGGVPSGFSALLRRIGIAFLVIVAVLAIAYFVLSAIGGQSARTKQFNAQPFSAVVEPELDVEVSDNAIEEAVVDTAAEVAVSSDSIEEAVVDTAAFDQLKADTVAAAADLVTEVDAVAENVSEDVVAEAVISAENVAVDGSDVASDADAIDGSLVDEAVEISAENIAESTDTQAPALEAAVPDITTDDATADTNADLVAEDSTADGSNAIAEESVAVDPELANVEAGSDTAAASLEDVAVIEEAAVALVTTPVPRGFIPKRAVRLASPLPQWTPTPQPTAVPRPTEEPVAQAPLNAYLFNEARWIDVNLSTQYLTAYENGVPVFSTYISSGLPNTPTVVGQFRIYLRLESQDMNGYQIGYDYYTPNVPYVMYFHGNYAIHGAYWHNNFGNPMSHGCVNASVADSQWLFNFAGVGTLVNVHY